MRVDNLQIQAVLHGFQCPGGILDEGAQFIGSKDRQDMIKFPRQPEEVFLEGLLFWNDQPGECPASC